MLKVKSVAYWFWLLDAITKVKKPKHWLPNTMWHATNAMLPATNAMLPATIAILHATNAMMPGANAMLRFNFGWPNQC